MERISQIKYSPDSGCGHCGNTEFRHINAGDITSDVYCTKCGAQFYSLNYHDSKLAGTFKDRYRPADLQAQYDNGFHKQ